MPIPLLAGLIAGGLLGGYNNNEKQKEFDRQRQIQAETTRFSPWTHMQAPTPTAPGSPLGAVAGGALSGYMLSQQNPETEHATDGRGSDIQNSQQLQPTRASTSSTDFNSLDPFGPQRNPYSPWQFMNRPNYRL